MENIRRSTRPQAVARRQATAFMQELNIDADDLFYLQQELELNMEDNGRELEKILKKTATKHTQKLENKDQPTIQAENISNTTDETYNGSSVGNACTSIGKNIDPSVNAIDLPVENPFEQVLLVSLPEKNADTSAESTTLHHHATAVPSSSKQHQHAQSFIVLGNSGSTSYTDNSNGTGIDPLLMSDHSFQNTFVNEITIEANENATEIVSSPDNSLTQNFIPAASSSNVDQHTNTTYNCDILTSENANFDTTKITNYPPAEVLAVSNVDNELSSDNIPFGQNMLHTNLIPVAAGSNKVKENISGNITMHPTENITKMAHSDTELAVCIEPKDINNVAKIGNRRRITLHDRIEIAHTDTDLADTSSIEPNKIINAAKISGRRRKTLHDLNNTYNQDLFSEIMPVHAHKKKRGNKNSYFYKLLLYINVTEIFNCF